MSTIADLKAKLVDTLMEGIENGVTVTTKQGGVVTIAAPAPFLAVAAKVIKDWAGDIDAGADDAAKREKLAEFLRKRRPDLKVV